MPIPKGSSPEALHLDPGDTPGSLSLQPGVFIGLDWGSTHVRAWLFDEQGKVLAARRTAAQGAPEERLAALVEGWPDRPMLACGMVGARGGWLEVPYASAPAGPAEVAVTASRPPGGIDLRIVGGVAIGDSNGRLKDVMRGEETLVFGLDLERDSLVILPGTHSKWVEAGPGGITNFRTYMTGDLFAALSSHTALARSIASEADALGAGLDDGLRQGLAGALTASLFALRVADLDGRSDPAEARRRLSGLLIGDEIRQGLSAAPDRPVVLVADAPLDRVYARGLMLAGIDAVQRIPADEAAQRGLFRLWRHLSC